MVILIAGLVVFFGVHSARMVAPAYRDRQLATAEARWKGLYSVLSLVGLALVVWGWMQFRAQAPEVYEPPTWGRHTSWLLVGAAFVAIAAAYLPAGHIRAWVGHPMITGVGLWAAAHLLTNGDLASVLVFGAFLAYAVVNRIAVAFRGEPPTTAKKPVGDLLAIAIGLAAFGLFGALIHPWLFGFNPFA